MKNETSKEFHASWALVYAIAQFLPALEGYGETGVICVAVAATAAIVYADKAAQNIC